MLEIRSMGFSRLLARLCHFLCNKIMLHDRASSGLSTEWESTIFVKIHTSYAALYARLRRRRNSTLFQLPVVLMCIRAACETIFRDAYPDWAKTPAGLRVLHDIDVALTELLDPDRWHSKISIFESSLDALRVLRDPAVRTRGGHGRMTQKQAYGTSPVIRSLFAGDKKSTFTKRESHAASSTPRRSRLPAARRTPRGTAHDGASGSAGRLPTTAASRPNRQEGTASGHDSSNPEMLPMHVREQLFRTALQRGIAVHSPAYRCPFFAFWAAGEGQQPLSCVSSCLL